MDVEWWPLFGVRITTPRLELRAWTDDDADEYAQLLDDGLHPPGEMPFGVPFTDARRPVLQREACQFHWRTRANWQPDAWRLPFLVREHGRIVGQQDLAADQFALRKVVTTGSFLGLAHQDQGIGTEMRTAVLHLAFASLGAERAETEAFFDNPRSIAVTRKLGYEPNGDAVKVRRDQPSRSVQFALTRERWQAHRRDDIAITGLDAALAMFGAEPPA
jgi:RimJ/RimL family protein N-acetyltransferase